MNDIHRAQFSHYPRATIKLHNLAATRQPLLALTIANEPISLTLGPVTGVPEAYHSITLATANGNGQLYLDPDWFVQLCQPWIGGEELSSLPLALRKAALNAALTPLLRAFQEMSGFSFHIAAISKHPGGSNALLGLWPKTGLNGRPSAVLHPDDALTDALIAVLERRPIAPVKPEPWPNLPICCTLWVGQTSLIWRELRHLEYGDILLLAPYAQGATLELILRQQSPLAAVRLNHRQLHIDRLVPIAMAEQKPANSADSRPAALDADELVVRIDFDLGHLTLPLRELKAIQPGYSFELDRVEPHPVRIMVGSQQIGQGELVQIEDRLGVRVTTLIKATA